MTMGGKSDTKANQRDRTGYLPDHLGLVFTEVKFGRVLVELAVKKHHLAPNGYLHAGSIVTLADSACGFGCMSSLPEKAVNFTTIELKANFLGTATSGMLACEAEILHSGRTTQVWDAVVYSKESERKIAMFRCTQMILYPPKS